MVIEYFKENELMVVDFVRLEKARTPNHFLVTFSERKGDYELINAEDIFDIRKG